MDILGFACVLGLVIALLLPPIGAWLMPKDKK
jgi:hypothetical protein